MACTCLSTMDAMIAERNTRLDLHVWHLVAKMLAAMGYGK